MVVKHLLVIFWLAVLYDLSHSQEIEDVRLVDGTYGDHMGRVEVLVNGTWGTVCNDNWNYPDGRTTCRMLNLTTVVCIADGPTFGDADGIPVLVRNVICTGNEDHLNNCQYELAGPNETCGAVAGVVCVKRVVGEPSNVTQVDATTTSVTIEFQLPTIPDGVTRLRFRLQLDNGDFDFCYADNYGSTLFQCTYPELSSNTTYRVTVRVDVVYSVCIESGYLWGIPSGYIEATTTPRAPQPTVEFRLVPPRADATFMGRLEVLYNDTWGTVCDDAFQNPEANVACETLGYPRAICYAREGRLGQGSGPIWIDNLDCSRSHDVLSECTFNDWGDTNCDHNEDIGVICWPDEYRLPVSEVRVIDTTGSSITLTWQPYTFPPLTSAAGYEIQYAVRGRSSSLVNTDHSETQYTIRGLQANVTYTARIRARFHFSEFCISRSFRTAEWSTRVSATTVETAPTAPPSFFHVVVLNSTAIEFQWELPPIEHQNGIIRGYKLFVRQQGSAQERMVDVSDSDANEFIVTELSPSTAYLCSMLAYTTLDGPRTFYLTASTFANDYTPFIIRFGINGDGLDKATKLLGSDGGVNVLCGTGLSNATINWLFSSGSVVGSTDRNIRQAKYSNGTTVLQLANDRIVDYCDAGAYICRAVSSSGEMQERQFLLRVNNAPPTPGVVYAQSIGSTWITITWRDPPCDGGHEVTGRNIRYGKDSENFILPSNTFIYNVNASLAQYTIYNLEPSTSYNISIQSVSADFRLSNYSAWNVITTLQEAPSSPRSVRARLVSPSKSVVEVRWREPAATNGIISQYTVLVTGGGRAIFGGGNGGLAINWLETFNKTYLGHIGAANITVHNSEVNYYFRVRASNLVNGVLNHGDFSEITQESTVFVPNTDLPVPRNVQMIASTNSTATLTWDYPETIYDPITGFLVAYSAHVEWYSPQGTLVMLEDSGEVTLYTNRATVSQLTPATRYTFRVSAIVESGERGAEVLAYGSTSEATGKRLAYFQLRISRIANCYFWQERSVERIQLIRDSLLTQLNSSLCAGCLLSNRTIRDAELSCRHDFVDQIVFRARITGNGRYSATGLVDLLQSWAESGSASVVINSVRYHIDPTCSVSLDSLQATDCAVVVTTTTTTAPTTSMPIKQSTMQRTAASSSTTAAPSVNKLGSQRSISGAEIGGLIIGVIIALLLLLFVILLAALLYRNFVGTKGTKPLENTDTSVMFSSINDPEAEFKSDFGKGNGDFSSDM